MYNNDGIQLLKSLFIWTTEDPYSKFFIRLLFQFNEVRPVFDGDLGQLLGIDPGGRRSKLLLTDFGSQNNFSVLMYCVQYRSDVFVDYYFS
jgi:hypothetical protein